MDLLFLYNICLVSPKRKHRKLSATQHDRKLFPIYKVTGRRTDKQKNIINCRVFRRCPACQSADAESCTRHNLILKCASVHSAHATRETASLFTLVHVAYPKDLHVGITIRPLSAADKVASPSRVQTAACAVPAKQTQYTTTNIHKYLEYFSAFNVPLSWINIVGK